MRKAVPPRDIDDAFSYSMAAIASMRLNPVVDSSDSDGRDFQKIHRNRPSKRRKTTDSSASVASPVHRKDKVIPSG